MNTMECGFESISEGNKIFGMLSIEVDENKSFYTKSDLINLKVVEQAMNFSILLSFIDLFSEKVLIHELPLGNDEQIIRALKKFILQIKNSDGLYYLNIRIKDTASYRIFANADTHEIIEHSAD